jgi:hypothetical protein
MKSALKIIVPLVVLVGVVFGITFLSMYTPKPAEQTDKGNEDPEPPLRFFTSQRKWDPLSDELPNRVFPPFFEPGEGAHRAPFWFENRNPKSVLAQLKHVSCGSCSGMEVAVIPAEKSKRLIARDFEAAAVGTLPPFLDPAAAAIFRAVSAAGTAADLFHGLEWKGYEFKDTRDASFEIPPGSAERFAPQWGILNLTFKPKEHPKLPLVTQFATAVKETGKVGEARFEIFYTDVEPFYVEPTAVSVGELTDSSPPRTEDLVVYSLTRGPGRANDLKPPAVAVEIPNAAGDPGKLVAAGAAVPLSEGERRALGEKLAIDRKWPEGATVTVTAAYRVPVTVSPKVGSERLDIGLLERDLWVSVPGVSTSHGDSRKKVTLKGTVVGDVFLADGKDALDLGSFKAGAGVDRRFELYTTKPGVKLSVAKYEEKDRDGKVVRVRDHVIDNGRVADDVLKVTVEKQDRADPDREYYWVKVSVPANAQSGNFMSSYVVLDVKGQTDRRIRIPIKGGATGR